MERYETPRPFWESQLVTLALTLALLRQMVEQGPDWTYLLSAWEQFGSGSS
jgi:hypothetical protein